MKAIVLTVSLLASALVCAVAQTKPIPIGVKIEAEGGAKGQGMWAQAAEDLNSEELKKLQSLVVSDIQKQQDIKIVELSYSEDFIGVVVVAAKLPSRRSGAWYYVASSVLTIAKKDGTDELVTHDIVAGDDLESVARTVAFQFASTRLRAVTGLWK